MKEQKQAAEVLELQQQASRHSGQFPLTPGGSRKKTTLKGKPRKRPIGRAPRRSSITSADERAMLLHGMPAVQAAAAALIGAAAASTSPGPLNPVVSQKPIVAVPKQRSPAAQARAERVAKQIKKGGTEDEKCHIM